MYCEQSHPDIKPSIKCKECGREYCKESIHLAQKARKTQCPYCDADIYSLVVKKPNELFGFFIDTSIKESLPPSSEIKHILSSDDLKAVEKLEMLIRRKIVPVKELSKVNRFCCCYSTEDNNITGLVLNPARFDSPKLEYFPDEVCTLKNLRFLSFYFNEIKSIPNSLRDLTSLETLFLGSNEISSLPQSIGKL